ncbi:MAG: glycosyltransferase family 4 protein [Candidatus Hermodarchaeota archaeon]
MKKILIYSPLALENGRGGEISSMELAKGLNEFFDITFVHTNILIGKRLLAEEAINSKLNGVKINCRMRFATMKISNLVFTFPYPSDVLRLFRLIKKNDIIYLSCSTFKQNFVFMFNSLLNRHVKYIVGYRKPLQSNKLFSLYNIKYRLSLLFYSLFRKRFYHHALSRSAKKYLENFYEPDKISHIIHGIDLNPYIDDVFKAKSDDILKFIYIGYLDDIHKGINVLVHALDEFLAEYKSLKVNFEFCGMGPLEDKIKALEINYPNNIKFNGYVRNDLIPDYYKKSDVFLFTSRVEPFPRTLMESLAAGLLVICSKTIGSIELLKGKEFGYFIDNLNQKAIKEKILEVYKLWESNPIKFRKLQKSAKNFVFQNYSTSREIKMFKSLITEIIKVKK